MVTSRFSGVLMYDRWSFSLRTAISLVATGVLVGGLVLSGTTYAMPLAGVGGFTVTADEITSESAVLYPGYGQTQNDEKANLLIVELRDVKITGLTLTKQLDTSNVPGVSSDSQIVIDSERPVSADQLVIKTRIVAADSATLNNAIITERTSSNPSDSFLVSAGDASGSVKGQITSINNNRKATNLKGVELEGQYIAAGALTIPDVKLRIEKQRNS